MIQSPDSQRSLDSRRSFFPFGNPFRVISPKGSRLSSRLLTILYTFEEALGERLKKLNPKDKDDVLSLTWLKLAMESLSETHSDIKTLITDLELPLTDWDEKWIDVYLDISVKLLDIAVAFSSGITRLNQGHLLLQCVLQNLKSYNSEKYIKVRTSLDSWRQQISSKNPRVQNCRSILDNLAESMDLPKVKNSPKGKVLMRALYGVKVQTVFICSVFAAVFSGSSKNLLDLKIYDTHLWAQAFSELQANVYGGIRNISSYESCMVLKELNAVDLVIKQLYPMIQDGLGPLEVKKFQHSLSELGTRAEKLSQGLDLLAKEVDGFFNIVLTSRDALLCNLRTSVTNPTSRKKGGGQLVQ